MKSQNIAFLQPLIPHYRSDFFRELQKRISTLDIYVYDPINKVKREGFHIEDIKTYAVYNIQYRGFLWYNPLTLLQKKYDTLVLMWHFAHITTWLLLLTKFIHRKKIILWGQGISVKRYLKEEIEPNILLKWMLAMADGAWIYMEKEAKNWQSYFPNKRIVALNNTLNVTNEISDDNQSYKERLKKKYNIKEKKIFIFCARFTNPHRRTDLLIEAIEKLNKKDFGFIIIGEGYHKPKFTDYKNVYDFGMLYDTQIKQELFTIADLYFQPGWVGLSIVEAMAYGKPICTFIRSKETLQCVEYSYITNGENGLIFKNINDFIKRVETISFDDIKKMGNNAKLLVREKLTIENMVKNAISIL